MQDEQQVPQQETDLLQYFARSARFLKRTYWLILVAIVLGAGIFGLGVQQKYVPSYSCRAVFSVHVDGVSVADIISSTSTSIDAQTTKQIVNTFPTIISADAMYERILGVLHMNTIPGSVNTEIIANSNLFTITATASAAEDAYKILNAVLECYPDMAFMVIGSARVELIEAPEMPTEPDKDPGLAKPMIIGGILFGIIAFIILCLIGQTERCVSTTGDMKAISNLSCIVHVPEIQLKRRSKTANSLNIQNKNIPPAYEEAIRIMRSRILELMKEKAIKKIVVTSTLPGEGKSTIAANLAINLSGAGLRTILVDADLRTQELGEFFDIKEKGYGLADLFQSDTIDPASCLTTLPDTDLRLLCGTSVARPISLLRREKVQAVLEKLEKEADLIVIDTPPIGLLADASAFAQCSDCAIYVVRTNLVPPNRVSDGLQMVQDSGAELLGYVLNGVSAQSSRTYGYDYSYRYSYSSSYYRKSAGYGSHGNYSAYSSYGSYGNESDQDDKSYGGYGSYGSYGGYGSYGNSDSYGAYDKYSKYGKYGKTAEQKSDTKSDSSTEKLPRKKAHKRGAAHNSTQFTNEILETLDATSQNREKRSLEARSVNTKKSEKSVKK